MAALNAMRKIAILFAGKAEKRHLNDLESINRVLVEKCGMDKRLVITLFNDGTLEYDRFRHDNDEMKYLDGSMYTINVLAQGAKEELQEVFQFLSRKVTTNDLLYLFFSGHGDEVVSPRTGKMESIIYSFNSRPYITVGDLGGYLQQLPPVQCMNVVMTQCYSGGFKKIVMETAKASTVVFMSSCSARKESVGNPDYNPYTKALVKELRNRPEASAVELHSACLRDGSPFDSPQLCIKKL